MATKQVLRLPPDLDLQPALCFAQSLAEIPTADVYELDCSALRHAPPFGMLLTGACLRQFRDRVKAMGAETIATGIREDDYPAHMGLWHSFGAKRGKRTGEARGSDRYLPITKRELAEVRAQASLSGERLWMTMERIGDQLAEVLIQQDSDDLAYAVGYAIRELFRNIADHSEASELWYCAQYWPTQDRVELGILDEGRGMLASLKENPEIAPRDEEHAIRLSVCKGVTRVNPMMQTSRGLWPGYGGTNTDNGGLGLFVISRLAEQRGTLFLLSNTDGVLFEGKGSTAYQTAFRGTAIRLSLKPSCLGDTLPRVMAELQAESPSGRITPSMRARAVLDSQSTTTPAAPPL